MLDLSILEKFDTQKMYAVYDRWPEIARESFESNHDSVNFDGINHIVFAGMGGSGAIGDVCAALFSQIDFQIDVIKGYLLPKTVKESTLVIVTSVSGNTAESFTLLKSAIECNCKIIALSSGGLIEDFCIQKQIFYQKIKLYNSPRESFSAYLFSLLKILQPILPKGLDVQKSIEELENISFKIGSSNLTDSNPALKLAEQLPDIPIIYYPFGLQAAAIRFKNCLQENSKTHAIVEDIQEASHNGIVAWERFSNIVKPILIQGDDDYIKTKERWSIIKDFFDQKNINFMEVHSISGNILSKIVCLIYLLDYTTIYRAVILGIDPSPVRPIDFIKNALNP